MADEGEVSHEVEKIPRRSQISQVFVSNVKLLDIKLLIVHRSGVVIVKMLLIMMLRVDFNRNQQQK